GISTVVEATFAPFQAPNKNVTFATPAPASGGTVTGPRKPPSPKNWSSANCRFTGGSPGFLAGNSTSATGWTPFGNGDFSRRPSCEVSGEQTHAQLFVPSVITTTIRSVGLSRFRALGTMDSVLSPLPASRTSGSGTRSFRSTSGFSTARSARCPSRHVFGATV